MTIPNTKPDSRDRRSRCLPRIALIGALVPMTVLGDSIAFAGTSQSIKTARGVVTFEHRDEVVRAKDTRRDGLAVQGILAWRDAGGKNRSVVLTDATGDDVLSKVRDLSIPEGRRVWLTMCYLDDGVPVKCSRAQGAIA